MDFKLINISFLLIVILNYSTSPPTDPLRASITEQDQRAFIKCHVLLGDTTADIYHMIQKIARRQALTRQTVHKLANEYRSQTRTHTHRMGGPGAPRTQSTQAKFEQLVDLIIEQDDYTEEEFATELNVSQATISRMLTELGARKIAARWIPHELNIGNKQTRIDVCKELLEMYKANPECLDRIITIDESWLRGYDPQDAQSAKRWCLPGQPGLVLK